MSGFVSFVPIKWVGGVEYEQRDDGVWFATGDHEPGLTNTPRRGELEGSRDRKPTHTTTPRAPGAPDMSDRPARVHAAFSYGAAIEFVKEYEKAREKHGPMNSAHEGYAVILEELDELKAHVWQKQKERDYAEMRREVIQLGAMTLAFLVEIVDTENRK